MGASSSAIRRTLVLAKGGATPRADLLRAFITSFSELDYMYVAAAAAALAPSCRAGCESSYHFISSLKPTINLGSARRLHNQGQLVTHRAIKAFMSARVQICGQHPHEGSCHD